MSDRIFFRGSFAELLLYFLFIGFDRKSMYVTKSHMQEQTPLKTSYELNRRVIEEFSRLCEPWCHIKEGCFDGLLCNPQKFRPDGRVALR